jgi:hypothetical protein
MKEEDVCWKLVRQILASFSIPSPSIMNLIDEWWVSAHYLAWRNIWKDYQSVDM